MESSFVKADIFFFVTTVAVVFISVCLVIVLVYLIQILKDVKSLSRKAKEEGEKIIDDVRIIREKGESKVNSMGGLLTGLFEVFMSKNNKRKTKKED